MGRKKNEQNEEIPRAEVVPADAEDRVTLAAQSLEDQAKAILTPQDFEVLKFIAVAIGKDGMTPQEACMLANVEYEKLIALMQRTPIVASIVKLKELEYKRSLMKALSVKARSGDDKLATMLLESRYPEEFGKKGKGGSGGGEDLLAIAIQSIQEEGGANGLITTKKAVVVTPRGDLLRAHSAAKELESFLV